MIERISRPQLFMEIAHSVSKRSTCYRLNVGAVCVIDNNIVSIGYNGVPSGEPHCSGNDCPGRDGCSLTIHAELNALKRAGGLAGNIDLYVTDSPCMWCASAILDVYLVKRLFFSRAYRVTNHLEGLSERVEVYQITPAGYIIDWFSREMVNIQ